MFKHAGKKSLCVDLLIPSLIILGIVEINYYWDGYFTLYPYQRIERAIGLWISC